jgi:hypothetical protein
MSGCRHSLAQKGNPMNSPIVYVFAAVAIAIIAGVLAAVLKFRADAKGAEAMAKAIIQYFRKIGVSVTVQCTLSGKKRYTAFIESEPMKQLRLSHIIETSLRDHLHNLHRLDLEKVYWRFPMKGDLDPKAEVKDEYITEGLAHTRYLPKVEAEEASWETFEEAGSVPPKREQA